MEVHVHAVTSGTQARQAALIALVEACKVAHQLAWSTGQLELAGITAQRGRDAAQLAERPDLVALAEMQHLTTAEIAARDGRTTEVATHLGEARSLAAHTGERNHMRCHFGPTNATAWELTFAVEAGTGAAMAERLAGAPIDLPVFDSEDRAHYVYRDLARTWAQAGGARDAQALRALDTADRLWPVRC